MRGAFAVIARERVVIAASPLISLFRRQLPPRGKQKNSASRDAEFLFYIALIYAKSACAAGRMTSSRNRAASGWSRWSHSRMTV